jgi:outer membrane protein OmpA-like peptidoglycan-associated protein
MPLLALCLTIVLAMSAQAVPAQQVRADTFIVHFAFDHSAIRSTDSINMTSYFRDPAHGWTDPAHSGIDSVRAIGYTDTVGSRQYNLRLSERRAISVVAFVSAYLPVSCSKPCGYIEARGETDPLPGDDSLSRRTLLIVYYHLKPAPIAHVDTPPRAKAPGEPDTVLALDHINFIANKAELTQAALDALPSNVANLRPFRDRYLEIDGYCNQPGPPLAKTDILFILSVNRAKFIYEYLITQGFDSTHLSYKGLGNASPVNAHPTTASEMDKNMRVEIKVFHDPPKP